MSVDRSELDALMAVIDELLPETEEPGATFYEPGCSPEEMLEGLGRGFPIYAPPPAPFVSLALSAAVDAYYAGGRRRRPRLPRASAPRRQRPEPPGAGGPAWDAGPQLLREALEGEP